MALQEGVEGRRQARYKRLSSVGEEKFSRPKWRCWLKRINGRVKGLRLSRPRKLNWKAFSLILWPRRIARIYGEIVKRMKMDEAYPAIVFSCQWGLPVLSHSSVKCRRSSNSYGRALTLL